MEIATLDLPRSGGTNLLVLPLLKVPPLAPSPTLLSMVCGKYFFSAQLTLKFKLQFKFKLSKIMIISISSPVFCNLHLLNVYIMCIW